MKQIVQRLVIKTVIRYQNKDHRLNLWSNLIEKYRHKTIINRIESNSLWQANVVDYIVFHYEQTYEATMYHRNTFKNQCLPLIPDRAQIYQQRRLSVDIISKWYQHQKNKRHLNQKLHGLHRLCLFRKKHIEYPLQYHNFNEWSKYTKNRKNMISLFVNNRNIKQMKQYLNHMRKCTKLKQSHKIITKLRDTRKQRLIYIKRLQEKKNNGATLLQSYFRMFHVKSIMNEVKNKLSSINNIFKMDINSNNMEDIHIEIEEFKELNETEYIFDQSIIDFDLQPLSNPVEFLYILFVNVINLNHHCILSHLQNARHWILSHMKSTNRSKN